MDENNRTVISISQSRNEKPDNVKDKEIFTEDCPSRIAMNLRYQHYKQNLIVVTNSHPLHQCYVSDLDKLSKRELDCSILIELSNEYA